jgi:hypothetical protein
MGCVSNPDFSSSPAPAWKRAAWKKRKRKRKRKIPGILPQGSGLGFSGPGSPVLGFSVLG